MGNFYLSFIGQHDQNLKILAIVVNEAIGNLYVPWGHLSAG